MDISKVFQVTENVAFESISAFFFAFSGLDQFNRGYAERWNHDINLHMIFVVAHSEHEPVWLKLLGLTWLKQPSPSMCMLQILFCGVLHKDLSTTYVHA